MHLPLTLTLGRFVPLLWLARRRPLAVQFEGLCQNNLTQQAPIIAAPVKYGFSVALSVIALTRLDVMRMEADRHIEGAPSDSHSPRKKGQRFYGVFRRFAHDSILERRQDGAAFAPTRRS